MSRQITCRLPDTVRLSLLKGVFRVLIGFGARPPEGQEAHPSRTEKPFDQQRRSPTEAVNGFVTPGTLPVSGMRNSTIAARAPQ